MSHAALFGKAEKRNAYEKDATRGTAPPALNSQLSCRRQAMAWQTTAKGQTFERDRFSAFENTRGPTLMKIATYLSLITIHVLVTANAAFAQGTLNSAGCASADDEDA